jgi:hypothetical protein
MNAGQRQDLDVHPTGLCSSVLGELLMCQEICQRVPGKERICSMRYLYTLLQWASQRIAEQVRARVGCPPPVSRVGSCAASIKAVAALVCARLQTTVVPVRKKSV